MQNQLYLLDQILQQLGGSALEFPLHNFTSNSVLAINWRGGEGQIAAQGNFGGGTLMLQFSLDGGTTWTQLEDDPASTLTAEGSFAFRSMKTDDDYKLQLELTSATSPDINVKVGDNLN